MGPRAGPSAVKVAKGSQTSWQCWIGKVAKGSQTSWQCWMARLPREAAEKVAEQTASEDDGFGEWAGGVVARASRGRTRRFVVSYLFRPAYPTNAAHTVCAPGGPRTWATRSQSRRTMRFRLTTRAVSQP